MLLSVIVCTYLREESLRNLLLDLIRQEEEPHELIVVDQTPDHEATTEALLCSPSLRIRRERRVVPNLPAARNDAIAIATGEVLVFVDDDVRLSPQFLRDVRAVMLSHPVDAIAPLVVAGGDRSSADLAHRYGLRGNWMDLAYIPINSAIGACLAVRRSVIEAVGGFDEMLAHLHPSASGEDLEFTSRITRAGYVLALVPDVRVKHELGWPGGCGNRTWLDAAPARRALAYITLKQEASLDRLSLVAAARLIRIYIIRRDVARSPSRVLYACCSVVKDIRWIRRSASTFSARLRRPAS